MKKNIFTVLLLLCGLSVTAEAQETQKSFKVEVSNTWNKAKADEPVVIKLSEINPQFRVRSAVVMNGSEEIPSQLDDLNGDLRPDELAFVIDLPAKSKKTVTVTLSSAKSDKTYPARVYAEMLVSDKRGKHVPVHSVTIPGTSNIYNQMHHHGPAFESELVYKRQVLLVGGSCGLGALKGWDGKKSTHIEPVSTLTERIIAYGPVRTIAEIEVTDWQYQGSELRMTNRYTLYGGHRDVFVETFFEEPLKDEIFCTGVIDIKGSVSYSDHKGLIGCWGTDWPVNDTVKYAKETVGLGTYIPQKYVKAEVKDKANYLYTIGAKGSKYFTHNITFTSMKETFGYKTPEAWFAYIREWKEELEHPAVVKVMK